MPDLEEAEDLAAGHAGLENHAHGRIVIRIIRQMRFVTNRLPLIGDRIKALEDRVTALEEATRR